MVLLSKLEETLIIGNERYELGCNQYPGAIHPQGYGYLRQFRLEPFPIFTYEVEGLVLEKRVFMVHGENTTVVEYAVLKGLEAKRPASLELRPLISFRDYHSTAHENNALNREAQLAPGAVSFAPYAGLPALHLAHNAQSFEGGGDWYRRFQYERERDRGLDFEEDLFNPGVLKFALSRQTPAVVIASTDVVRKADEASTLKEREIARRREMAKSAPANDDFTRALVVAADQFIVARGEQKTVIAGYPWFSDWGRDTMISLPGLTLATGRHDVARSILLEFSKHVSQGMLPNRFPDSGEAPEYNTVDATLWYFEAIRAYTEATADLAIARQLYPVLLEIIQWHVKGTRHGIHVEEGNGLLAAGEAGVQLTWMDAKVGDWVVTPRVGKPVEIQALWYNALRIMEDLAARFSDEVARKRFNRMATLAQYSFNRLFWNEPAKCLYDVVNGANDASLRPNQIFAVSLPHSMLSAERARLVVDTVERELLTPAGLRTLAASDPRYMGRYHGDQRSRDAGRRARELYRGLRVGRERAERFAYVFGQVCGDLALKYRGAGDDRHAERLRRFEQRDVRALICLVLRDERFRHCEVEGELDEAEAVIVSARLARKLEHSFERVVAARDARDAEAVPRRHAVELYAARRALAFELLEGCAQTLVELLARDRL